MPSDEPRPAAALLASVALFRDLPPAGLEQLAAHFTPLEVAAQTVIVRQGAGGDELYVVEAGTLAVTAALNGRAVHLGTLGPGDIFGEMAVLRNRARTATVTATTPARLWTLTRAALIAIVRQSPDVGQRLRAIMRQRELANALRALQ